MAWKTMETAPKDGGLIKVRRDNGCSIEYAIIFWRDRKDYPWKGAAFCWDVKWLPDNNSWPEGRWDEWISLSEPAA